MHRTDLYSAGLLIVAGLALAFIAIPLGIDDQGEGDFGLAAGTFPLVSLWLVIGLSAFLLATRLPAVARTGDEALPIPVKSWLYLALVAAVMAVSFVVFLFFGFVAGAPLVVAAFMMVMGERRPLAIILTAIAAPLAIWLFFWKLLSFPLP